jgi:hypothetical protein
MPGSILKRTRPEEKQRDRDRPSKKPRKFKKQTDYHSSSDEDEDDEEQDFQAVNLQDSDDEDAAVKPISRKGQFVIDDNADSASEAEEEDGDDAASDITGASSGDEDDEAAELSDGETSTIATSEGGTKRKKRNDPTAFATSISKILSSKLTSTKRSDPVLSRSVTAQSISKNLADSKLEAKARSKLRADRKLALEKGRVRDVLGLETTEESTAAIMETERKLKKTAQRGVVKLFNAVREAQRRGEEARVVARVEGTVGIGRREEKVSEMSKQGFLDLISSGGKKTASTGA